MSERPLGIDKVVMLPGVSAEDISPDITTDYARLQSPNVIDACLRLGLDPEFVPIFEQHLNDLHLVTIDDQNFQKAEQVRSRLDVQPLWDGPTSDERRRTGEEAKPVWSRLLIVSQLDIETRVDFLQAIFEDLDVKLDDTSRLRAVAGDWIFGEQAISALGNSCHMRNTMGRYVPNLNGQSNAYLTENTVSTEFFREFGLPEKGIANDALRLQQGFGLQMLHESLLGRNILRNAILANRTMEIIRELFPAVYRIDSIAEHLKAMKPRPSMADTFDGYFSSFLTVDDVDMFEDITDVSAPPPEKEDESVADEVSVDEEDGADDQQYDYADDQDGYIPGF